MIYGDKVFWNLFKTLLRVEVRILAFVEEALGDLTLQKASVIRKIAQVVVLVHCGEVIRVVLLLLRISAVLNS